MKMANFPTFYSPTHRPSLFSPKPSIKSFSSCSSFHYITKSIKQSTRFKRKPFILSCSSSSLKDCSNASSNHSSEIWADSDCVEVIGIGSRVDAVLDFCLQTPSSSQSLRFWNVVKRESFKGQLQQRFLGKDAYPSIMESPPSHLKAVVLVASSGYGDDYVVATDILRTVRSGSGLAVAVIIKPFSFEGQRRRDEVKMLVDGLQDCVNFCIDIDIDTLLKMDLVTLDEALKTAYRAVSSAISAVSILVSDRHQKHIHSLHGGMTQITLAEVTKVLGRYKEGRVGFGVAHNVESSIVKAVFDCPFLSMGLKDLDGVVICVFSSSSAIGGNEVCTLLQTFREATECTKNVILSIVQNPDMKPNLISTTVITVGAAEGKSLQKSSILSRLADSIPFVFNFLRKDNMQSDNYKDSSPRENIYPSMLTNFLDKNEVPDMMPAEAATENFGMYSGKEMPVDESCDQEEHDDGGTDRFWRLDAVANSSKYIESSAQGTEASEVKPRINRNIGPGGQGYRTAQEWHEEESNMTEAVPVADNPKVFQLPVGVRLSDDVQHTFDRSNTGRSADKFTDEDIKVDASAVPNVSSFNGFTDSFEVVTDFWNSASTSLRRKQLDVSKKQGVLSARAASMLEAERNSKTKWSPVMKIRYRGGIYKGRCQGGLPEGRGRLTFSDGSVYDGMWRYGKRSGLGSLFFSNGDVFHGSWRDDLMQGKGWLYFHTGERWFANFWKGRANGEGRFYSKSGEIFFGHFQDGWRDGHFLCVKVDGTRYLEIWREGVLMSCEELDS